MKAAWEVEYARVSRCWKEKTSLLVKRWIDAPVMKDLHCSFITRDLCRANSNQLLNYEPSRPCRHYGGGFSDWLGECLTAALPGTEAWFRRMHTHMHTHAAIYFSVSPPPSVLESTVSCWTCFQHLLIMNSRWKYSLFVATIKRH